MDVKSQPFLRTLRLLWNRMGPGRIYFVGAGALLFVLAAVGLGHLVSSPAVRHSKPSAADSASKPATSALVTSSLPREPVIAITEIGSTETKGRDGQFNVAVRIGVAPRPNPRKGEVEIRVSFFDITPTGEMRPTDAQVDYQWTTPVRDWTDPTPKYLVATYLSAGASRKSAERARYGGFLVRVYFDGQLQAEQSEPKALLTALHSQRTPPAFPVSTSVSSANVPASNRSPMALPTTTVTREAAPNPIATNQSMSSPSSLQANRNNSSPLPRASPVPDKPGFVYSPYNPKFIIDVRGFPPGTEVTDPNTGKVFRVP
ncbi:MAG TPA: hypothetical protein VLO30_07310 [Chthoniobacterales bacterium]|nr:hypothetical protein [Chthoniobacterales bacterium]